ncbi:hypothetical protein SUGI_0040270 [Cryptomeria japonica]|nr:hypothetical protein SUGI_0040270 [Cryptomeria japonica]
MYSLYLEQFIVLLEKAIALKRKPVRIDSYEKVDNIHRDIPMLPLQSFICPITKDVMRDAVQIASEWRERNYNIKLENANELLNNVESNEEEQLKVVQDLQALCEEESLNKYKVANKNLIPRLVKLAKSSSMLVVKAFSTLVVLAKQSDEHHI